MYIFQLERYLLQKQVKKFGHYIRGSVLDLGSGELDRYGKWFNCEKYTKMDIFENPNVDVVGSADSIPFPDSNFDSVIATQVFEHVPYPEKSASEVFRVLKPGGYFLMTVPQTNELHEEPHDYWRYTKFGIKELFERHGLYSVEIDQRGGFFVMIGQIQMRYLIDRFHLHSHRFLGRVCSKIFHLVGNIMIWLDSVDTSTANRKHAIGWCAVFKKS